MFSVLEIYSEFSVELKKKNSQKNHYWVKQTEEQDGCFLHSNSLASFKRHVGNYVQLKILIG